MPYISPPSTPTHNGSSAHASSGVPIVPLLPITERDTTSTVGCAMSSIKPKESCFRLGGSGSKTSSSEDESIDSSTPESSPPTPDVSDSKDVFFSNRPPLLQERAFSFDDVPAIKLGDRPRLHRRTGQRASFQGPVQQSPSPDRHYPAVHSRATARDQPLHAFSRSSASSSEEDSDSSNVSPRTVWPEGDPKSPQKAGFELPQHRKPFPAANSLNLEGVPPSPSNLHLTSGSSHQRSASTSNVHDQLDYYQTSSRVTSPVIRKKSGEVVWSNLKGSPNRRHSDLRPPTPQKSAGFRERTQSAPATPVEPKNVHFKSNLVQIKLYAPAQQPSAVSNPGTPEETTEEEGDGYPFPSMGPNQKVTLVLPNFTAPPLPSSDEERDVFIQSLNLHRDSKSLQGAVSVRNLAFHKRVVVRFTMDDWQTTSEVSAHYAKSHLGGTFDEWAFSVKLTDAWPRIEEKRIVFAVRYAVDGMELWDNNSGHNYHVGFKRESQRGPPSTSTASHSQGQAREAERVPAWTDTDAGEVSNRLQDVKRELTRYKAEDDHEVKLASTKSKGFSSRYDFNTSLRSYPSKRGSPGVGFKANKDLGDLFSPPSPISTVGPPSPPSLAAVEAQIPSCAPSSNAGVLSLNSGDTRMTSSVATGAPILTADGSDVEGDYSYMRSERFNSFPPTGFNSASQSRRPAAQDPIITSNIEELGTTADSSTISSSGSSSIPLTAEAADELPRPDLQGLQRAVGSGSAQSEVHSYSGFIQK